jgi:hypothetical protein
VDLRWWPVALAGSLCLAIGIALAAVLPMRKARHRLRPLAHVDRLTLLPEYTRAVRLQFVSMVLMVVLLAILFVQALLASSRPAGMRSVSAAHPEDIMLCVGEPVTDPATAELLNYFSQRTVNFDTQRIGLTSPSLRVVPLTRDYQYAADEFSRYAKLAALQRGVDSDKPMAEGQLTELRSGLRDFSQPLDYVDYARSTQDVLALCMAGFPSGEDKSNHRRSLIYLGAGDIFRPDEQRPPLFSTQRVEDMAAAAGIQVNVMARADAPDLRALAADTGGRFEAYESGGSGVDTALDDIRANAPMAPLTTGTGSWDSPNVPLIGGIVVSVLLCISLAVLRR